MTGLKVKYLRRKSGVGQWCYAERGKETNEYPTFVLIHGFGGSKDDWPNIISQIPTKYHCILVDLPGQGDTTYDELIDDLSVQGYVDSLNEFLQLLDLKSEIYLIGCSFGGAVAGMYSHKYPKNIRLLALLCPAIPTPILTDTCQKVLKGQYELLIPSNGREFTNMIDLMCFKRVWCPQKIMQSFVNINFNKKKILLHKVMHNLVTKDLLNFESELKTKFSELTIKTIVVWGKQDEMLHVSGARFLKEHIANCEIRILDECGHVLQFDQPKKTAQYLIEFLHSNI